MRGRFVVCVVALAALSLEPVAAGSPPTDPILRLNLGMQGGQIDEIGEDASGRFILTCSEDKTAMLWDADTGKLLRVYRVPITASTQEGRLFSGAISPDGTTVAVGGWTGYDWDQSESVYLFDRQSGSMTRRLTGLENVVNNLHFSKDGAYLAAALGDGAGIAVWETQRWTLVGKDGGFGGDSDSLDFVARSGALYVAVGCYDANLRLYRISGGLQKIATIHAKSGNWAHALAFSPDGSELAVGYDDTPKVDVYLVSDRSLTYEFSPDTGDLGAGGIDAVRYSNDGATLYAAYRPDRGDCPIRAWADGGRGSYQMLAPGNKTTIRDVEVLPNGNLLIAATDPSWEEITASGTPVIGSRSVTPDFRNQLTTFSLGPGGTSVGFGLAVSGSDPAVFDIASRSYQSGTAPDGWKTADTTSLAVTNWQYTYHPALDGKPLDLTDASTEWSLSVAVAPGAQRFLLGTLFGLYCFDSSGERQWYVPLSLAWDVNVSDDGRLAVVAIGDGTIRWFRMSDGKELLSLFTSPDRKRWVLWTPSGYYDASPGGEDLVGWTLNQGAAAAADFFPASRFRSSYYRPDVVALVLPSLDEAQAVAQANTTAGRSTTAAPLGQLLPPVVTIMTPDEGSTLSNDLVGLQFRVDSPSGAPVTAIRALIDGRPVPAARGVVVVPQPGAVGTFNVRIPDRSCAISILADDAHGTSVPATVNVVWQGTSTATFVIRPTLYVLAVGVSNYQNSAYKLNFAAKDAQDFASCLTGQKGRLYGDVQERVLTDAAATRDAIDDGLDWIQKETTSHDVAMIFLSGHGVNDSIGTFYYLPVEADVDRLKRTGVPFGDIKTTVASIAGKTLLFVDSCHSGDVWGGEKGIEDTTAMVNELSSAENGAIVFTASTGNQFSYEDSRWSNGAFTKALVEGLSGQAAYNATKGDDRITVNMLDLYISERVKELTDGRQSPTTIKPDSVPDFPVAMD